jgi:predicted esterase
VKQAVSDLVAFIDLAQEEYGFDPDSLSACGFSNGANTALATLVTRPEVFTTVMAFGATKPLNEPVGTNIGDKRVFIANGERDPYAPQGITDAFASELKAAGAEVIVLSHQGGHQISPAHIQQINRELT